MSKKKPVNNLIVISDLHTGCRLGLCPPKPIPLDDGGTYQLSKLQFKLWSWWREFWDKWVPKVTKGEPFAVLVNGDSLDGVHHNSTTQISQNLADQALIAEMILRPVVKSCSGRFYMIRGTEAHVGKSGVEEERLAKTLGAIPNDQGQYARFELWARVGDGNCLIHALHHIGTTGSSAYETSAPHKELMNAFTEAAQEGREPPMMVVRAHRHRHIETKVKTEKQGYAHSFVTPGWQLKTPFAFKIAGARQSQPQIGGSLIRQGDEDHFTRHFVKRLPRPKVERIQL